jgi:hypothetical protein
MMNNSDYNLLTFKAISDFTKELGEMFATKDKNHSLKLYEHLLNKTTLTHEKAIKKHIDAFRDFCVANREAIINKDYTSFTSKRVVYSSRVYIDFLNIFKDSDKETSSIIWKHLLTISALVDPAGKAKKVLQESKDSKEANFLSDIINKVESNVKPNSNPLEAVNSIMSSGIFNDLLSGMNSGIQNGELDLGKLMGTVQTMCASLGDMNNSGGEGVSGDGNPMANMGNVLNGLMQNITNNSGENPGGVPDLSNLTSLLGPMLSSLGGANNGGMPTVEEITKADITSVKRKINPPSASKFSTIEEVSNEKI